MSCTLTGPKWVEQHTMAKLKRVQGIVQTKLGYDWISFQMNWFQLWFHKCTCVVMCVPHTNWGPEPGNEVWWSGLLYVPVHKQAIPEYLRQFGYPDLGKSPELRVFTIQCATSRLRCANVGTSSHMTVWAFSVTTQYMYMWVNLRHTVHPLW